MECRFEVGQRVVCVDDSHQTVGYLPNVPVVVQDMIYIIREIYFEGARQYGDGQQIDGGVCLRFEGLYRWAKTDLDRLVDAGFDHKRFRPVRTIDTTATVAALAQAMRDAMKKGGLTHERPTDVRDEAVAVSVLYGVSSTGGEHGTLV